MTLDPVFRSRAAVRQIEKDGVFERMKGSLAAHRETVEYVHRLLPEVIDARFIDASFEADRELEFLQNHFFLILFHSIFESLGCSPERLRFYARANFCIKGMVTAADNLFDDESKLLIPLAVDPATRFASILQLLCCDRLIHRLCDDARADGSLRRDEASDVHRALLTQLATIGSLEGSEEHGVDEILTVDDMVEKVHHVRGGLLFSLAFVSPRVLESGELRQRFETAERAIEHLGTAFQIVDDLTDFELDLRRRSHNILVAQAHHDGSADATAAIGDLLKGKEPEAGMVEGVFASSARSVLSRAEAEGRRAFEMLSELGFWFPPERSDLLVHAIVGIEGVTRMDKLTSSRRGSHGRIV